ncbi:hypothetical protein BD770DRAFT_37513 [Pilaira anomala]|nr:hypothetical protein BD770DRAFT_37513 [Pilaira anomala]
MQNSMSHQESHLKSDSHPPEGGSGNPIDIEINSSAPSTIINTQKNTQNPKKIEKNITKIQKTRLNNNNIIAKGLKQQLFSSSTSGSSSSSGTPIINPYVVPSQGTYATRRNGITQESPNSPPLMGSQHLQSKADAETMQLYNQYRQIIACPKM